MRTKRYEWWSQRDVACLRSTIVGREWPQERLHKAGLADGPGCQTCKKMCDEGVTGAVGVAGGGWETSGIDVDVIGYNDEDEVVQGSKPGLAQIERHASDADGAPGFARTCGEDRRRQGEARRNVGQGGSLGDRRHNLVLELGSIAAVPIELMQGDHGEKPRWYAPVLKYCSYHNNSFF